MAANVPRPPPRPSPSSRRPSSVVELSERALHNLWDPSKDLKQWLKKADGFRKAGRAHAEASELEEAFMEYVKSATIILEKLSMHKDYFTVLSPAQRHNLGLNGHQIHLDLGEIQPILVDRYEQWRLQNTETSRSLSSNDHAEESKQMKYTRHDDDRRSQHDDSGWLAQEAARTDADQRRQEQRGRDEAHYSMRSVETQPPRLQIDTGSKRREDSLATARRAANVQLCDSMHDNRDGAPSEPDIPVSAEEKRGEHEGLRRRDHQDDIRRRRRREQGVLSSKDSNKAAKLRKMLWEVALVDAQKVIELNPPSYIGYQLKNEALHGLQRYDEAIIALDTMLSKLDHVSDTHTRELRQQYVTSSEAASVIQEIVHAQLEDTPHRLINTITGRLCNRGEQTAAFKTSPVYKELLLSTMKHADFRRMERIEEAVEIYFRSVMLSHRWEDNEPPLRDIQDKDVYKLDPVGGIMKLQSFCKTARDAGYRWAWVDTCCIDQTNNVEVQQSVNSMFVWYRHSALTIVYLSDIPPSSKHGALAKSVWNQRGWTVQEFLAPKSVLFYQSDWTLYLDDRSRNHKNSAVIMRELGNATGIDPQALVAFSPGMRGAREKLQWVSTRITTLPEDIAYSLFGIFGIHLPVIYGEKKQNALGRLLQDVIAQSGDISCLDWAGKPSEFNSCLPADITSYRAPPSALSPPLSNSAMRRSISSLQYAVDGELTSKLYQTLYSLNAPQFMARRLRLPCIAFTVTEIRRSHGEDHQSRSTFGVKADGLHDLLVTTDDNLIQFSPARPTRRAFLLVRPWDRSLLELHDFEDFADTESLEDFSPPLSPLLNSPVASLGERSLADSDSYSRELRLIARLGQPFGAFLLAQQWGGEYKRIASDHNIIAQVKDMTAVRDMMDIRTLEIL